MDSISAVFSNSLSPDSGLRADAQNKLSQVVMDDSTLGTFFNYLLANEDINLKKAAAVFLKDYIRDYWMDNTDPALASPQKCLSPQVKESFKQNVLGLLLQAHPSLYPIIIEMILTVVHSAGGYLNIWPNLMSSLSQILQEGNYSKSLQIYYLITKTIKRYHYESKTEELFNEIQNTLDIICPRLTLDAGNILTMLENQQVGGDNLKNALIIMKRIFDIFYSLNYQDFPAYFEDHLQDWMNYLAKSLQLNIPNLDPEQTEWMKKLKAKTLKCLNLYFSNYYDDFSQYAPHFYPMVWEYLQGVSGNDDFSVLEKQLLEFFNINFKTGRLTQMQDQQLQTLIDKLIIPNLQISDKESEMFEDTPMEFIKAEFEETDMDSNKYYAMGLLQNIAEANQNLISSTIQPMIQRFLQEYESNRNALFKKKISAINLIFAIAIKTFAQRIGVTELNNKFPMDFNYYIDTIFTREFSAQSPLITQVYSIKFLNVFRIQIPPNTLPVIFSNLADLLGRPEECIKDSALLCLEKLMLLKDAGKNFISKGIVNSNDIFPKLFNGISGIIGSSFNPIGIKCFLRMLNLADDSSYNNIMGSLSNGMNTILAQMIQNPGHSEFNYYFFEAISVIAKALSHRPDNNQMLKNFQSALNNNFMTILSNNLTDLLGYYVQYYTLYLHLTKDFSDNCNAILQNVLNIQSWNLDLKYLFDSFIKFLKINFINNSQILNQQETPNKIFAICEQLKNLKCYKEMFVLLEFFVNFHSKSTNYLNLVGNLITSTTEILSGLKQSNPKSYNELGSNIILLIAKLSVQMDLNILMTLINQIGGFEFLVNMSGFFDYISQTNPKKILLNFYVNTLNAYGRNLNQNILQTILLKLIDVVVNFYKVNFKFFGSKPGSEEELCFNQGSNNPILNADVKLTIPIYDQIYKADEGAMFFGLMTNLNQQFGTNIITTLFPTLKKKDQDSLRILAGKHNFNF